MKSKVKVIKKPTKAIKELEKMAAQMKGPNQVLVGLPKESNNYPDGTSVIMVGAVHEFGSEKRNIPECSFLRTTMVEQRRKYRAMFKKLGKAIIKGKMTTEKALKTMGLQAQSDVQRKIHDIDSPPLRHRDGNRLIDTQHLQESITFEVTK